MCVALAYDLPAQACDACKVGVPSRVFIDNPTTMDLDPAADGQESPTTMPGEVSPADVEGNGTFLQPGHFHIGYSTEYRKWKVVDPMDAALKGRRGKHLHNFSQEWMHHIGLVYGLTDDLEVSASLAFRELRSVFIDDSRPAFIGSHDNNSSGLGDLELDMRWRVLRDPFELYLIAGVGIPTGDTHNKDMLGRRFEPEFQPGTGGSSTTLGLGMAKIWDRWKVHFEVQHTLKFEGERDYEFGDSTQLRFGGTYQLPLPQSYPPIVLMGDVIAQFNEPDVDRGLIIGGHRAKILYLVPGIAGQLVPNLTWSVTAPIPVAQDWAFHQEIDYSIRFSVGYSF